MAGPQLSGTSVVGLQTARNGTGFESLAGRPPRFRREHGVWPMTGYWYRRYQARIWRDAPLRHRNSCWSVLDPKHECDCGVKHTLRR